MTRLTTGTIYSQLSLGLNFSHVLVIILGEIICLHDMYHQYTGDTHLHISVPGEASVAVDVLS